MSVGQNTKVHCSISFRSTEYDALVPDIDYVDLPQTYHEEENNRMNLSTVDEARS